MRGWTHDGRYGTFGYTEVPRSSRRNMSIVNQGRLGIRSVEQPASVELNGISVVMRWVYAEENYPSRRSVRCKQGSGCWNMQTVGAWHVGRLTGGFKYYGWRSRKVGRTCLSYLLLESGSAKRGAVFIFCCSRRFLDWESTTASRTGLKDKPASGSVKILQFCRVS